MTTQTQIRNGKVYRIPADDIEYIGYFYGTNGREDLKSAHTRLSTLRGRRPDFLVNCELFDFNTRAAASDVVAAGKIYRLTEGFGMAFPENKRAMFSYKNSVNAPDYVGFYPTLIRGGVSVLESTPAGLGGSRGRTAMAVNAQGDVFFALVPDNRGGADLYDVAQALLDAGATDGGNFDGGGSSQWYSPGGVTYTGRPVRGFVAVWLKDEQEDAPIGEKTVSVRTALNIRRDPPNAAGINVSPVVGTYKNGTRVQVFEASYGWWRTARGWCYGAYLK